MRGHYCGVRQWQLLKDKTGEKSESHTYPKIGIFRYELWDVNDGVAEPK
jgi:hypothetical protein